MNTAHSRTTCARCVVCARVIFTLPSIAEIPRLQTGTAQRGTALSTCPDGVAAGCSDRDRHDEIHDEIDRGWRDDDSGRAVLAVWSRIKPAELRGSLKMCYARAAAASASTLRLSDSERN